MHQYRARALSLAVLGKMRCSESGNASSRYSRHTIESLIENVPFLIAGTNPLGDASMNSGYLRRFSSIDKEILVFATSTYILPILIKI